MSEVEWNEFDEAKPAKTSRRWLLLVVVGVLLVAVWAIGRHIETRSGASDPIVRPGGER